MPLFLEKGKFKKNEKDGLPIRNLLRELDDDADALGLIYHCHPERKSVNTIGFLPSNNPMLTSFFVFR